MKTLEYLMNQKNEQVEKILNDKIGHLPPDEMKNSCQRVIHGNTEEFYYKDQLLLKVMFNDRIDKNVGWFLEY